MNVKVKNYISRKGVKLLVIFTFWCLCVGIYPLVADTGSRARWDNMILFTRVGNELALDGASDLVLNMDEHARKVCKLIQDRKLIPTPMVDNLGGALQMQRFFL